MSAFREAFNKKKKKGLPPPPGINGGQPVPGQPAAPVFRPMDPPPGIGGYRFMDRPAPQPPRGPVAPMPSQPPGRTFINTPPPVDPPTLDGELPMPEMGLPDINTQPPVINPLPPELSPPGAFNPELDLQPPVINPLPPDLVGVPPGLEVGPEFRPPRDPHVRELIDTPSVFSEEDGAGGDLALDLADRIRPPGTTGTLTQPEGRNVDSDWEDKMAEILEYHEGQKDDILQQSYEEEARLARRASAEAAAMGYSPGGGGYGASMAQASIEGQRMRFRALLEHEQKGLDIQMGFLEKMFAKAQQDKDIEAEERIAEMMNETLERTAYVDAMLGAEVDTIAELTASGKLRDLAPDEEGGGGGSGGNSEDGGESEDPPRTVWDESGFSEEALEEMLPGYSSESGEPGRIPWEESGFSEGESNWMQMFYRASGASASEVVNLGNAIKEAIRKNDNDSIFNFWDKHEHLDKMDIYHLAVLMGVSGSRKANLKDKAEGVTWGDAIDMLPRGH